MLGKHMSKKINEGQRRYEAYWAKQMADPQYRRVYEEEAQKKELWLQLVEARQATGLTQQQVAERMGVSQAQVARIENKATMPTPCVHFGAILMPWEPSSP
jgi:DNA-binding transcriptional regulator YiaG